MARILKTEYIINWFRFKNSSINELYNSFNIFQINAYLLLKFIKNKIKNTNLEMDKFVKNKIKNMNFGYN